jgi:ABC-2 type transport system permease protein
VALVIGFRPTGDPRAWLGALALLALYVLALSWTAVGIGLVASSPESAASFGFVLLFLPYLSSAFVAVDTLPAALRPIAVHQPVTPLTEAIRGLLVGGPVAADALVGALWCVGLLAVVVPVTARLYRRTTA